MSDLRTETARDGISASVLKNLAMALMILNHATTTLFDHVFSVPSWIESLFIYATRASFIIFAFLTAEGLAHTSNRWKYLLRMTVFAVISEPFFDFCFSGSFFDASYQNVFFTHALALLGVTLAEVFKGKTQLYIVFPVLTAVAALLLRCDYSLFGVAVIYVFYYFRNRDHRMMFACLAASAFTLLPLFLLLERVIFRTGPVNDGFWSVAFSSAAVECLGLLILPLIEAYDGRRGMQLPKLIYYAVYPAHLLILGFVRLAGTH